MCGILAISDTPTTDDTVRAALHTMVHRGPDGSGVWFSPDRRVALGHTRLAVIDPATGAQPIANEDGTIIAVVNGEFYGYERQRLQLQARGHRFATQSDSELLLHLYEERGPACLEHLSGEFAFVLWDTRRRRLFAARDRFGIKPLCYHQAGSRLMLASEAKALFALGVPARWDTTAMYHVCTMQYTAPTQTLFAGLQQLPPGHWLLYEDGTTNVRPYWDIAFETATTMPDVRPLLEAAVQTRLRADVPVCFHLSGGLDSSTITALAVKRVAQPVGYTVAFDDAAYDEHAQATATAKALGVELRPVMATRTTMLDVLEEAVFRSEGLAINGHLPAKYLLAQAIRADGFKVVLSGEGADELFGGYAHLRQDLLEEVGGTGSNVAALQAANATMAGIQLPQGDALPLDAVQAALGYVPTFLRAKATLGRRMHALLRPEYHAAFPTYDPYAAFLAHFDTNMLRAMPRVNASSYLWAKSALANYILRTLGDGTEMAHGVEGRLPFLDTHLVEVVRTLPIAAKITDGVEKLALRQAVADVVPLAVIERRKSPFTAPPFAIASASLIDEVLTDFSPFFDMAAVRAYRAALHTNHVAQVAGDPVLMLIVTAQLLQRRFGLT